jgi:hypothetical protein
LAPGLVFGVARDPAQKDCTQQDLAGQWRKWAAAAPASQR